MFGYFFLYLYLRFLENMHFTKGKSPFSRFSLKVCFYNFRVFFPKTTLKNLSKMRSECPQNRCQKRVTFWHPFFHVLASILEGLGPPSWSQIGHLGLPGPSPKPSKSSFLGTCVQDASQEAPKWLQRGTKEGPELDFRSIFDEFRSLFSLFWAVKTD